MLKHRVLPLSLKSVICVFMTAQKTAHMPIQLLRIGVNYCIERLVKFARSLKLYDFLVSHCGFRLPNMAQV